MRIGDDIRIVDGEVVRVPRLSPEDKARAESVVAEYGGTIRMESCERGAMVSWLGLGEVTARAETFASAIRQLKEQIRIHNSQVA
jgi:hypothetical protein